MDIKCKCSKCGKEFLKEKKEYNRKVRLGKTEFYCSLNCSGSINPFGGKPCKIPIREQPNFKIPITNPFKYYMRNCRLRVRDYKKKELKLEIDELYLEEIWNIQKGICPYTGVEMKLNYHLSKNNDRALVASLDRIDSSIGYIKGNIQFISIAANYMKNNMTHEETISLCKIIAKNWKEIN